MVLLEKTENLHHSTDECQKGQQTPLDEESQIKNDSLLSFEQQSNENSEKNVIASSKNGEKTFHKKAPKLQEQKTTSVGCEKFSPSRRSSRLFNPPVENSSGDTLPMRKISFFCSSTDQDSYSSTLDSFGTLSISQILPLLLVDSSSEEFTAEEKSLLYSVTSEMNTHKTSWCGSDIVTMLLYNILVQNGRNTAQKKVEHVRKQLAWFAENKSSTFAKIAEIDLSSIKEKEEVEMGELTQSEEILMETLFLFLNTIPKGSSSRSIMSEAYHFISGWKFLASICKDIRNFISSKLESLWESKKEKLSKSIHSRLYNTFPSIGGPTTAVEGMAENLSEGMLNQINPAYGDALADSLRRAGVDKKRKSMSSFLDMEIRRPAACPSCKRGKVKCDGRRESCEKRLRNPNMHSIDSSSLSSLHANNSQQSLLDDPFNQSSEKERFSSYENISTPMSSLLQQSVVSHSQYKPVSSRCENCKRRKIKCDGSRNGCTRSLSPPRLQFPGDSEGSKIGTVKTTRCQPCKLAHSRCDGTRSRCLKNPLTAPSVGGPLHTTLSPPFSQEVATSSHHLSFYPPVNLYEPMCSNCRVMNINCDGKSPSCSKYMQSENEKLSDGEDPYYIIV